MLELVRSEQRRVAIFAENAAEVLLLHVGAIHAGVSVVSLSFHLTADEAAYILSDSQTEILFVGPENVGVGLDAAQRAGVGTVVGWRTRDPRVTSWESWLAAASPAEPPRNTPALPNVLYTSGTTGRPKRVELPPVLFNGGTVEDFVELFGRFRYFMHQGLHLVAGPMYHTGPLIAARVLSHGKPVVVLERFDPEKALRLIDTLRVETSLMVPTHFTRLRDLPEAVRAKYDLSSLKLVVHTGSACPRELKEFMIGWFGPVLVESYGATETGTICKIESPEWLTHPTSVGTVQPPFSRAIVVDDDGDELPPNTVGRLYFEDPSGRGIVYGGDPVKTAEAHLRSGVFTLGDIGYFDGDGYVYITDRFSDMVISGGVNIYPAESEIVLKSHPAVADVAVIGVPDQKMGEAVKALVVPRSPDAPPNPAELIAYCRERLAGFKCPRSVDLVATLHRTAMGKIDKRALRAPYWDGGRTIG